MSGSVLVRDRDGNILTPAEINTLCPVEYVDAARQIACDYFIEVEKSHAVPGQMLTICVGPVGTGRITHVWCPRSGYNNQVDMQVGWMAGQDLPWIGSRAYTLADDRDEILSKFVCMTDSASEILQSLGLEVVR